MGFWRTRSFGFRAFWFARSCPYRLRFGLRTAYYRYLFHFKFFRKLRDIYHILVEFRFFASTAAMHRLRGEASELIGVSEFARRVGLTSHLIEPRGVQQVPGPRFLGKYNFEPIGVPVVCLNVPKLEVYEFTNGSVVGGTNFVRIGRHIVHPDDFVATRDVCPAESTGIARLNLVSNSISLVTRKSQRIPRAISLLGPCTGNYAHWLTETLPKLLLVDAERRWDGYPLLVDTWIHPNFVSSIKLLSTAQRDLIRVQRWAVVQVDSLVDVAPPAYVPPELRSFFDTKVLPFPDPGIFPFSPRALDALRRSAHLAIGGASRDAPDRLYLFRSPESCGNTRHVTNIAEVEEIVRRYGYTMIDPARYSFEEQVRFFSNAKKIVSPLGAALANTIFSPPGCDVLGLSPWYPNANYYYFSNFMGALGHNMFYSLGNQAHASGHVLHKNYEIDLIAFNTAMAVLEARG